MHTARPVLKQGILAGFAAVILAVSLPACSTVSETDGVAPRLGVDHVQPLAISVGSVAITRGAAVPIPPGFSQNFPVLLDSYAHRRFIGDQVSGQKLVVDIMQADVKYARTESSNNVTRWMRLDGHDDYTLSARVRLTLQNAQGVDQISNELALENTLSLPDSLSLNERDARTLRFTENFMADLDARITQTLTSRFYVVTPAR